VGEAAWLFASPNQLNDAFHKMAAGGAPVADAGGPVEPPATFAATALEGATSAAAAFAMNAQAPPPPTMNTADAALAGATSAAAAFATTTAVATSAAAAPVAGGQSAGLAAAAATAPAPSVVSAAGGAPVAGGQSAGLAAAAAAAPAPPVVSAAGGAPVAGGRAAGLAVALPFGSSSSVGRPAPCMSAAQTCLADAFPHMSGSGGPCYVGAGRPKRVGPSSGWVIPAWDNDKGRAEANREVDECIGLWWATVPQETVAGPWPAEDRAAHLLTCSGMLPPPLRRPRGRPRKNDGEKAAGKKAPRPPPDDRVREDATPKQGGQTRTHTHTHTQVHTHTHTT
jgi:hypothetical protein